MEKAVENAKVQTSKITKSGDGHRLHIESPLMRESLVSHSIAQAYSGKKIAPILPDCNIIFLGGQSIIDRGKKALFPLIEEFVSCREKHEFVIGVGAGARLRHTFDVCLDLGIPTGGMAMVAGGVLEQNSRILWALLSRHKGMALNKENLFDLPLWLQEGMIPIMPSMPPNHFWEPPSKNRIPLNGPDIGMFLFAEMLGARSMIYIKDEKGLYTDNPKTNPNATFIEHAIVEDILEKPLPDYIVEKAVLDSMVHAKHIKKIQIINGLESGNLSKALNGEAVGTVIETRESANS
jgi:molybdenum storage protein